MRRLATRALALALIVPSLAACSTLGTGPSQPDGLPHGGTGPFRVLTAEELDTPPTPAGSTLRENVRAVESGMVAERHLFYAAADPLPIERPDGGLDDAGSDDAGSDDAGAEDAGVPDAAGTDAGPIDAGPAIASPDWSAFEPRAIFRSAPRENGQLGYDAGAEVLVAREAWEGGLVRDPWAIVLEDGRVLLYYAAEGGVGVAEASAIDGTFARVGDGRILELPGARRPTVIRTEGTTAQRPLMMYLERDGSIRALASDDGLAWDDLGAIVVSYYGDVDGERTLLGTSLPARDERDSVEVAVGSPGAVAARTPGDRSVVRLYFESRRADGQVLLAMAGSFDGTTFEGLPVPVFEGRDGTFPAPRQIDERITILYLIAPYRARNALLATVAPGGIVLP